MTTADVATPCAEYVEADKDWCLPRDLKGGSRAMRAAGERWLPKEQAEEKADYTLRLNRSFLYPGFMRAIEELIAKPFSRPVVVEEGLPPKCAKLATNIDRQGTDVTQFARGAFDALMTFGTVHFIADNPAEVPASLADEEKFDVRPYVVMITADNLLGYRIRNVAGTKVLSMVRIRESIKTDEGEFGEKTVKQVRVWTESIWATYRQNDKGEWYLFATGPNNLSKVPLVTVRADSRSGLYAKSPIQGVAELNLAHWQSQSDQRNILRFVRAGILWRSGVSADEATAQVTIGPGASHASAVPGATMEFVEHSGAGAEAGRTDLQDLKAEMAEQTTAPMLQQSGDPTATSKAIDEGRVNTLIHQWVRALEHGLEECFKLAAEWANETIPEKWGGVTIFQEFGLSIRASDDIRNLIEVRRNREITSKTFLSEIKRRGLLSDTVDIQDEIEELDAEGPDLGAVMDQIRTIQAGATKPAGAPAKPAEAPGVQSAA